ncbi:MAG: hypothetical protein J6K31_11925 [Parabacteroides sp.]|nr:hypothetical protein [Parabacteroides sp.]
MEKEREGCLIGLGMMGIYAVLLIVAYWLDIPFLTYICYLFPGLTGAYVGSIYFSPAEKRKKSRFSRRTWTGLIIAYLALAALLAWWLEGRLW